MIDVGLSGDICAFFMCEASLAWGCDGPVSVSFCGYRAVMGEDLRLRTSVAVSPEYRV